MLDKLPFPHITATKPEEQLTQLKDYLFRFKEELEFVLGNINVDNLSQELVDKLNSLGADVEKSNTDNDERIQQLSNKTLTVSDILNSSLFSVALKQEVGEQMPSFTINYETGQLEYK